MNWTVRRPDVTVPPAVRVGVPLVILEAYLLVAYFASTPAELTGELRYLVYPFAWINAGLWAAWRVRPDPGNRRHRALAALVGVAYFGVLMAVPGNLAAGTGTEPSLRVAMYAPGWGPILAYAGPVVRLYLVPFEVVGYAALAYLAYGAVLRTTRGAVGGALGLVTCVGCTVPVLSPLVGLLGGPASGLASTAYAWSYDLGTLVFLLTVGVLYAANERDPP